MILALMLGAAWWQLIPGYFLIGTIWAILYLPRSITLQAREYKSWRNQLTEDVSLATTFLAELPKRAYRLTPEKFRAARDSQRFTERAILTCFMLNIAIWPVRVLEKFFTDFMQIAVRWILEKLEKFWEKMVTFCRWIFEKLEKFWETMATFCRWIGRTLRRWLTYLYRHVLAQAYRWVYGRVTAIYQAIIHRANREAIADMAVMNRATEEHKK